MRVSGKTLLADPKELAPVKNVDLERLHVLIADLQALVAAERAPKPARKPLPRIVQALRDSFVVYAAIWLLLSPAIIFTQEHTTWLVLTVIIGSVCAVLTFCIKMTP
jgi:hypothetical protein